MTVPIPSKYCHTCNKLFNSKAHNAKYCSIKCSKKGAQLLRKEQYLNIEKPSKKKRKYNLICNYCRGPFETKNHRRKYCSVLCQKEGRKQYKRELIAKKSEEGICSHCLARPHNGQYCCDICHKNKLKSSKRRKKILKIQGRCQDCADLTKNDKILCEKCSKKACIRSNIYISTLKIAGLCIKCQRDLPTTSNKFTCKNCLSKINKKNLLIKKEVLTRYSNSSSFECNCCSVNLIDFLSLDHIYNNGAEDRRNKRKTGISLYRHLAHNNYPKGFQTLCQNCNLGKHINGGLCPHQKIQHNYSIEVLKAKKQILEYYGKCCSCCLEDEIRFLTIDHVNEDGAKHRDKIGVNTGYNFYRWIINNDFPDNLQTLCLNCNIGKHLNNGSCPHNLVT